MQQQNSRQQKKSNVIKTFADFIVNHPKTVLVTFWGVLFAAVIIYNLLFYLTGFKLYKDVPCGYWSATRIYSPSCGGTRMTHFFFTFNFSNAFFHNPHFATLYTMILVYLGIITVQFFVKHFRATHNAQFTVHSSQCTVHSSLTKNKKPSGNEGQNNLCEAQNNCAMCNVRCALKESEAHNNFALKKRGIWNWLFDNSNGILKVNIVYPTIFFCVFMIVFTIVRNFVPALAINY